MFNRMENFQKKNGKSYQLLYNTIQWIMKTEVVKSSV